MRLIVYGGASQGYNQVRSRFDIMFLISLIQTYDYLTSRHIIAGVRFEVVLEFHSVALKCHIAL